MRNGFRPMVHNLAPTKSEAYQQHRTCDRKKVYASYEEGWKAVRHIKRNGNDRFPQLELIPYVCRYCRKIHVGHNNNPTTQQQPHQASQHLTADLRQYVVAGL